LIVQHKNTITLNFGSYDIAKSRQDLSLIGGSYGCVLFCLFGSGYDLSQLPNEFDTSSREVVGLGYERQFKHGLSFGADYFQIKNSFVIPSLIPSHGTVKAKFYFATFKKYFGDPGGFQPFIGIGNGQVRSFIGGYINNSEDGNAAQAVAGLRYQTDRFSFIAKYRRVRTRMMRIKGASGTGDITGNLDLSGRGNFVGLGVRF
jgi:hypothetical protein